MHQVLDTHVTPPIRRFCAEQLGLFIILDFINVQWCFTHLSYNKIVRVHLIYLLVDR